ncbi:unnamed protein product [Rotaria magnacalcarata]|uniref:Uncharacterized protein n=3 Tax=Rotaria magnacalcarata TaxID=392030 RepID=A0A816LDQ2_9BILA|nr:unnamed protein product [Rotaria magnacalcarata]CAF1935318.1 unnamed protein product [Rotaria magnacalcarata]CAF3896033.1 unnamed protein product [Rotaria magnacalcarata]CAF4032863.1 unnamed protein product [Rotaria magnacalcarata]
MNVLAALRKELPNEKLYLFINRFIFSFLFLFVGLPLWYSTTSTYRAPLPYSRISTLAPKTSDLIVTNLTSFQTASSYDISFYLINNNDDNYSLNKTKYEEIISSTIVPHLINTYSNFINLDFSTEIIFNTRGVLPYETIHNLERRQIPFFINKLEYLLHRSTKHYKEQILFILFIPDEKQTPLTVEKNQDNSIVVPKWGSVIFYNKNNSDSEYNDLNLIMKQFLAHFNQLLGIETIDQWINLRTIENYNNGRQTLSTLSQLLLSIPNIVIDDTMAKKVHDSVDLLEKCEESNQHNDCQQGRLLADQVFFDPSLLKLLYFPDDQKFAIYVPLYLPMGAPLAWALFNDIKFLINIMSCLIRNITSSAIQAINRSSSGTLRTILSVHVRTIFSSSAIGLDNFKLAREQHASRHAPSIDGFKKRFLDSINKPDSQIFTEDLRNMIMSANSDEEVDAVIQALRKYNSNKVKFTDFHFGSPIMRLLYIQNKSDLAMQLFMDESLKDIFNDSGSVLILLNKLIEDKRYDDATKIFEYGMQRGFSTASGRVFPTDAVTLAIEALYRQNTKQSLEKAKDLISKVIQRDADINPRAASMIALLALQHNESSFAMEIIGAVRAQNLTTIQNIRAICYAEMGRAEEAINIVHILADQPPIDDDRRRVFPIVLTHIKKSLENSTNEDIKNRFEDLSKFVTQNNRLSAIDLVDFLSEPIIRRQAIVNNRFGVQQSSSGNFQRPGNNYRDAGFQGGYNKKLINGRQENSGNRYIRRNS